MSLETTIDRVVWRADLQTELNVTSNTVLRWMKAGKLPPPDVNISRKTKGWRLSTLHGAGISIDSVSQGRLADSGLVRPNAAAVFSKLEIQANNEQIANAGKHEFEQTEMQKPLKACAVASLPTGSVCEKPAYIQFKNDFAQGLFEACSILECARVLLATLLDTDLGDALHVDNTMVHTRKKLEDLAVRIDASYLAYK